jgi:hypothetical protein
MDKRLKDPNGGLTAAGRAFYKRTEGAHLKPGVRNYGGASPEDKKRWVRWALRFTKTPRPLRDAGGNPTRYALMFKAWGKAAPTNNSQVAAVHREALRRRAQLGMGEKNGH